MLSTGWVSDFLHTATAPSHPKPTVKTGVETGSSGTSGMSEGPTEKESVDKAIADIKTNFLDKEIAAAILQALTV